jgi:alkylmercury lyase
VTNARRSFIVNRFLKSLSGLVVGLMLSIDDPGEPRSAGRSSNARPIYKTPHGKAEATETAQLARNAPQQLRSKSTTRDLAEKLSANTQTVEPPEQRMQIALFRRLAEGEPVAPAQLAHDLHAATADVVAKLRQWHGVHTDSHGRVVAFQGLSIVRSRHQLRIDGRTVYAWCAWDTLFLPELIGRPAEVESDCPETGERVTLTVGSNGPENVAPSGAVLSFRLPDAPFGEGTIESFCNFIHFISSREAAERWAAAHADTFVISIEDGFEIGRLTNSRQWGDAR